MIQRLIVPISIIAISLASVLQGLLWIDDGQLTTGAVFILAGVVTIVGVIILHRRGKI